MVKGKDILLCENLPNNFLEVFLPSFVNKILLVDNEDIDTKELIRMDWLWSGCRCVGRRWFWWFDQVVDVHLAALLHRGVERNHLEERSPITQI